jgi:pyruvate dehydrogenase E2 component (dihydrolipoamide acetyltransferase)
VAIAIVVPRLGWSMDEGTFHGWRKDEGDRINPGDVLFVLESEKATEDIESVDAGILRIPPEGPKPGDTVKVGQVLAYLCTEGEAIGDRGCVSAPRTPVLTQSGSPGGADIGERGCVSAPRTPGADATGLARVPTQAGSPGGADATGLGAISPRARRVAAELRFDWKGIQGTGRTAGFANLTSERRPPEGPEVDGFPPRMSAPRLPRGCSPASRRPLPLP